jgi:hypothetical protein
MWVQLDYCRPHDFQNYDSNELNFCTKLTETFSVNSSDFNKPILSEDNFYNHGEYLII